MGRRQPLHGQWSSRVAFILAATGAAVGLGNIWKFPYVTGVNGGGAFVIIYIVCVLAVGLPIMMAEVLLGRRGRRNPITTMRLLSEEETGRARWQMVGWLGVLTGMLILSYYSVIAGWTMDYAWQTAAGAFEQGTRATVTAQFARLRSEPGLMIALHSAFMLLTVLVVARGVEEGLERALKYLMPILFLLLALMVVYAMTTGHFLEGLHYMFNPDFSEVSASTVLRALGQAFFSLSVGMGAIMAYGAYLPDDASIGGTTLSVVLADTLVALLAGMAIFPIVFNHGLDPAEGPALLFHTLPLAFGHMPGGRLFGTLFFVLLIFAAWTSSIGLVEPAVARLVERRRMRRGWAALTVGGIIWLLGLVSVFAYNGWSEIRIASLNLLEAMDYLASNILLPLSAFLIALFAGWLMSKSSSVEELELGPGSRYAAWRFLIRYVAPIAVLLIALHVTGVLDLIPGGR